LAGVGQHAEDVGTLLGLSRDLERARERRARGDADENAFLRRQFLAATDRFGAGDRQEAIDQLHRYGITGDLGNEVRCPTLHRMRLEARMRRGRRAVPVALLLDAAAEKLRVLWLANDDLRVRALLLQHARHALERAASAVARYPIVQLRVREIVQDFARGGARVIFGIRLVLELP